MELEEVLESLRAGRIGTARAQKLLSIYSIERVGGFARLDVGRKARRGVPEVVFAEGKTAAETRAIVRRAVARAGYVLVSRVRPPEVAGLAAYARGRGLRVDAGRDSTSMLIHSRPVRGGRGRVGILCAGTSDIGVAEEARLMCRAMNCDTRTAYDVGVAGLHRLLPALSGMAEWGAGAIVAVAGMEGALATVVSSLADAPVIGVPSSVGYGYGRGGVAALAAMLQSCALGMAVVNIDNGIGAGAAAAGIARRARPAPGRRAPRK